MIADSNLSWQGIKRKVVYTEREDPVCKCTGQCTGWGIETWECKTFFNWFLKLTNQKRPKVTCLVRHLD